MPLTGSLLFVYIGIDIGDPVEGSHNASVTLYGYVPDTGYFRKVSYALIDNSPEMEKGMH